MKFIIERASLREYLLHNETDKEILEKMRIPEKFRDKVQIKRENLHCIENYVSCYIEIQTLEELLDLYDTVGDLIVMDADIEDKNICKIKIYDYYVE